MLKFRQNFKTIRLNIIVNEKMPESFMLINSDGIIEALESFISINTEIKSVGVQAQSIPGVASIMLD